MSWDDLFHKLNIPQDIIDKGRNLGLAAEALGKAIVKTSEDAARHWLQVLEDRLNSGSKP